MTFTFKLALPYLPNADALNKKQGYFCCSGESIPYVMYNLEASMNIF